LCPLFTNTYLGLLGWLCAKDGTKKEDVPAPDAEEYIVTALIFASSKFYLIGGMADFLIDDDADDDDDDDDEMDL